MLQLSGFDTFNSYHYGQADEKRHHLFNAIDTEFLEPVDSKSSFRKIHLYHLLSEFIINQMKRKRLMDGNHLLHLKLKKLQSELDDAFKRDPVINLDVLLKTNSELMQLYETEASTHRYRQFQGKNKYKEFMSGHNELLLKLGFDHQKLGVKC